MFPWKLIFAGDVVTRCASDTITRHLSRGPDSTRSPSEQVRYKSFKWLPWKLTCRHVDALGASNLHGRVRQASSKRPWSIANLVHWGETCGHISTHLEGLMAIGRQKFNDREIVDHNRRVIVAMIIMWSGPSVSYHRIKWPTFSQEFLFKNGCILFFSQLLIDSWSNIANLKEDLEFITIPLRLDLITNWLRQDSSWLIVGFDRILPLNAIHPLRKKSSWYS